MSLRAEIIAVGTELTNGAKLDTNSQWISRELEDLGHPVGIHSTVADSLSDQVDVLKLALSRSDLVIMTGGLGPTLDDLARDAIAAAMSTDLVLDQPSLAAIEAFFAARGRAMPERNRIQAMFPKGSEPLPNPIGTAPGIWVSLARDDGRKCLLASLPGVPSEMKRMFHEQVVPRLPPASTIIRKHVLHCFGLGESDVEQRLGDLTARGRVPEVGITAHEATISLRIVARGTTEAECQSQIEAASAAIHVALGERVFGSNQTEIEDVVMQQLAQRNLSLVTLETGPSSYFPSRLLPFSVKGNEDCPRLLGSFCFASMAHAHAHLLQHAPDAIRQIFLEFARGDDSVMSFEPIARACQRLAGADVCIAVGYPLATNDSRQSVGDVVVIGPNFTIEQRPLMLGSPDIRHSRLAKTAIDMLRRKLMTVK